jgi:hypothetical protein
MLCPPSMTVPLQLPVAFDAAIELVMVIDAPACKAAEAAVPAPAWNTLPAVPG